MLAKARPYILVAFLLLAILAVFGVLRLRFSFDFEQFFPQGDEDLAFFQEFIEEFESDDNFLFIAVKRQEGVFDSLFLEQTHQLTLQARDLPHVVDTRSLTSEVLPLKTPFTLTAVPVIHRKSPKRYEADKRKILADERFVNTFISEDATSMLVFLKIVNAIQYNQAQELMPAVDSLVQALGFEEEHHLLGRPYFQTEIPKFVQFEFALSFIVSGILVTFILFLIFRRFWGVAIALVSLGLGMLLFMGFVGWTSSELNGLAALYPVLMIIVGTSDLIHIIVKYVDELRQGKDRFDAMWITIKEIGLATLMTSITTAIGFATLLTSRIQPVSSFGINAAFGVLIAYITVVFFTTTVLTFFRKEQIGKLAEEEPKWLPYLMAIEVQGRRFPMRVIVGGLVVIVLSAIGISKVSTNYKIVDNLPTGEKVTEDFLFFERMFAGFRPYELAVLAQGDYQVQDYEVMATMNDVEEMLREQPEIKSVVSPITFYKSINQVMKGGAAAQYAFPTDTTTYLEYRKILAKLPGGSIQVLESKDGTKARMAARMLDVGADSIKQVGKKIDAWISENVDPNVVQFRKTGTGLIVDKNSVYVKESLLWGLSLAIGIVSLLMALLFRNWKMLFVAMVPNMLPLVVAGALLGFVGIELEAGVSIVFGIIFGIAVDDTIHFLGRYKLLRMKGISVDDSIVETFRETGKALVLTTVVLFFGFLILLFSKSQPSVSIGLLISFTLVSALVGDLYLLPVLLRWVDKDDEG